MNEVVWSFGSFVGNIVQALTMWSRTYVEPMETPVLFFQYQINFQSYTFHPFSATKSSKALTPFTFILLLQSNEKSNPHHQLIRHSRKTRYTKSQCNMNSRVADLESVATFFQLHDLAYFAIHGSDMIEEAQRDNGVWYG